MLRQPLHLITSLQPSTYLPVSSSLASKLEGCKCHWNSPRLCSRLKNLLEEFPLTLMVPRGLILTLMIQSTFAIVTLYLTLVVCLSLKQTWNCNQQLIWKTGLCVLVWMLNPLFYCIFGQKERDWIKITASNDASHKVQRLMSYGRGWGKPWPMTVCVCVFLSMLHVSFRAGVFKVWGCGRPPREYKTTAPPSP